MATQIEFVFKPEVQAIFDNFCAAFGIRIAFFSPAGKELRVGKQKNNCRFCQLLRVKLGLADACLAQDRNKRAEAARQKKLIVYQCHAGLTEAITPVYILDQLIGYVMIGQFRRHQIPPSVYRKNWTAKYKTDELADAFFQVPYIPPERVDNVLGLFDVLVKFIISQHMIGLRNQSALQPVLAHMQEHLDQNLSLSEAAAIACRSTSTLSHLFRKKLGKGFKQVQIEMKLSRAEEYFRTVPGVTIQEVAYKLGFKDPLYFSRLFKKYRGFPPSTYRPTG